ncbi:hypothetical protein KC332_g11493 [Hortaea werneckii]|uniref:Uncharacterized protein n=1 Tax=Hortaea werneckii TaxID=91943 RepID=A0A3M7I6R5_HORWE|nr:hypothetical protein KC358_g11529 [Hortaea werneckii]KAI6839326.1 hypothetical protein KC350_g5672 [Hortaea werneckii]KAI6914763.1 hypothetical protein KC348_g12202 [Hortaea werneckii]KAI6928927.1 hypothetical protein KC341_g11193 [Hortaea werneckii]KAI6962899.1 hypothetical protein KC321_g11511 [Hortaea werneckii]
MHFSNILATSLLASTAVASPLYRRTQLSSAGHLRPKELVTRELEVRDILEHLNAFERRQLLGGLLGGDDGGESADSPTGSSTSDSSLGGSTSSSETSSNVTSSSSSTSCEFLGGCSAASGATCPVDASGSTTSDSNTSSSICGSSTSTNTSGFIGLRDVGGKLMRRIGAALSFSRA